MEGFITELVVSLTGALFACIAALIKMFATVTTLEKEVNRMQLEHDKHEEIVSTKIDQLINMITDLKLSIATLIAENGNKKQ